MSLQDSRNKNANNALFMLALATAMGDKRRQDLARAILRECGYPGGEDAPPLEEAIAATRDAS
jgi:hypothetical protein